MAVAGVDVGAVAAKAVILREGAIAGYTILPTGHDVSRIGRDAIELALQKAKLTMDDLNYVVATGYGRRAIAFANEIMTEISCHARGANWVIPETRTIIDIGGQDSKAIRIDAKGNVVEFLMNDKCAAGTGRFLEVMARALELSIDEFASISLTSQHPCTISSVCTVFAESEVISLRAEKNTREDIIAGLHQSIAHRVGSMVKRVGCKESVVFTGGVARNTAMLRALEKELGFNIIVPEEPQIMGALGAALIALKTGCPSSSVRNTS